MGDLRFVDWDTGEIFDEIKAKYKEIAGEELEIGSNGFAISSAVAYILGCAKDRFNEVAKQRFLSTATGEYLTALGESLGVVRPKEPVHATMRAFINWTRTDELDPLYANEPQAVDGIVLEPNKCFIEVNGARFTPLEPFPVEYFNSTVCVLVGCCDDIDAENGVSFEDIGTVDSGVFIHREPVKGLSADQFECVGGGIDITGKNLENDDAYRQYIRDNLLAHSNNGSEAAYKTRAKYADGRVTSVAVINQQDAAFAEGMIKVFITADSSDNETLVLIKDRVEKALTAADWMPLADIVVVEYATPLPLELEIELFANHEFKTKLAEKVFKDLSDYAQMLRNSCGKPFTAGEIERLLMSPDENGAYANSADVEARYSVQVPSGGVSQIEPSYFKNVACDKSHALDIDMQNLTVNVTYTDKLGNVVETDTVSL